MNEELIKRLRERRAAPFPPKVNITMAEAADTIEAQAAEIERLRDALEPFRMVAYDYEGTRPCMAVNINVNLLRAARTALENKK